MIERDSHFDSSNWHLDKRINIGHVLTTLALAVSVVVWMLRMESRVEVNATQIANNTLSIDRVEHSVDAGYREIIRRLERIEQHNIEHAKGHAKTER